MDIKFRTTTVTSLKRMERRDQLSKLAALAWQNAESLRNTIEWCSLHEVGSFRVNSQILPVKTHPHAGYSITDLPGAYGIVAAFESCGDLARQLGIRLSFHPDQFVVLNSPRQDVVDKSIEELKYQAEVADWIGADVLNIHAGGSYGDKKSALDRLVRTIEKLPHSVLEKLSLENDDKIYSPIDLLPVCHETSIPLVYDVHHHRCLADSLCELEATELALQTWNREPLFHLSSPREGWGGPRPNRHHDYIDRNDFPIHWKELEVTIEIEAKAKELAILELARNLFEPALSITNSC